MGNAAITKEELDAILSEYRVSPDPEALVGIQPALEMISYTFGDSTFLISPDALDDLEIIEWIEDEKLISAIRRILGADQWEKFKEANRTEGGRVTSAQFEPFLNGLFKRLNAGKA